MNNHPMPIPAGPSGLAAKLALKATLLVVALMWALPSGAQSAFKFGYLSYEEAIRSMPDYPVVRQNLDTLRRQYEDEIRRSEEEFNEKYEAFLDVQGELAGPILRKRQAELQDLLAKSVEFRNEARRLLRQARGDMYAPLEKKLADLLAAIGKRHGYAFILNTDGDALPYVDPACGEDITDIVKGAIAASAAKHAPKPEGQEDGVEDDDALELLE